jgi:hypothetical protein
MTKRAPQRVRSLVKLLLWQANTSTFALAKRQEAMCRLDEMLRKAKKSYAYFDIQRLDVVTARVAVNAAATKDVLALIQGKLYSDIPVKVDYSKISNFQMEPVTFEPDLNFQAQSRLHRPGRRGPRIHYMDTAAPTFEQMVDPYSAANDVKVVDVYTSLSSDCVHPTAETYKVMMQSLVEHHDAMYGAKRESGIRAFLSRMLERIARRR